MNLNLPFMDLLADSQRILIAGAGGGFDFLGGVPIYLTLKAMGKSVHLANYSFMPLDLAKSAGKTINLIDDLLIGAGPNVYFENGFYSEGHFAEWYQKTFNEDITVWIFADTGVIPLKHAYTTLVEHLGGIDMLILMDGGVDSLMRGDEVGAGTLIEDCITLCAIQDLDIPYKILGSIGFGAEIEEQVSHFDALKNMSDFIRAGGFLGCCALTKAMPVFQHYAAAGRYIWEKPDHYQSHIHTRVIPAVEGEFGDFHLYPSQRQVEIFVSPLMTVYWFFKAETVIAHNQIVPKIGATTTKREVRDIVMEMNPTRPIRPIPL